MLASPTLFVIGAGASSDLNFPLGVALRDRISDILDIKFQGVQFEGPDQEFADYLAQWCFTATVQHHELWQAATSVSRALPLTASIDSYLDSHLHNRLRSTCGKLAIARVISAAENQSALTCNNDSEAQNFDFRPFRNTWYQRLWSVLQTGVTPRDPQRAFNNLRIITFNYDRNIERFLQLAYAHFLDVPLDVALEHVEQLGIIHVYGSLGTLDARPDVSRSFRTKGYTIDLSASASSISTYTEQIHSEMAERIRKLIWESQRIVFLGFSFGTANMNLFSEAVAGQEIQRQVYATTYQMYYETVEHVRTCLDSCFSRGHSLAHLSSDRAADLFDRYTGVF